MSGSFEKSTRNEMIYILQTFELEQGSYGEYHSKNEKSETTPSYCIGQVDLKWIQWAEGEPRYPECTHRCKDEPKDEVTLRIDLAGLFEEFIARSDCQRKEKEEEEDEISDVHCMMSPRYAGWPAMFSVGVGLRYVKQLCEVSVWQKTIPGNTSMMY
jgi:hypothetical protein